MHQLDSALSGISIVKEVLKQNIELVKLKKLAVRLFPELPEAAYDFVRIDNRILVVKMHQRLRVQQARYLFHDHLSALGVDGVRFLKS